MNKRNWAILLSVISGISYFFPQWNGFAFGQSLDVTSGDGHIISAIFLVGALLLWYLPERNQNK